MMALLVLGSKYNLTLQLCIFVTASSKKLVEALHNTAALQASSSSLLAAIISQTFDRQG
jgi:hypothetical protein